MDNAKRAEFYKNQQQLENEIIEASRKAVDGIQNILIKELIESITIDSLKHKGLLSALRALVTKTLPFISEEVSDEIKASIKRHIELESQAIKTYKEMIDQIEDDREKFILKAIYMDELRHHSLLQKIYKKIVEKETLDGDAIWDLYTSEVMPQY